MSDHAGLLCQVPHVVSLRNGGFVASLVRGEVLFALGATLRVFFCVLGVNQRDLLCALDVSLRASLVVRSRR